MFIFCADIDRYTEQRCKKSTVVYQLYHVKNKSRFIAVVKDCLSLTAEWKG